MNAIESIEAETLDMQEEERSLYFTYPTYKDMFDNNIIFAYRGVVTSDLVTNVLEIMEERLEEDGQSKKLSKKVFNVMVECLTNVYVDEERLGDEGYDPQALLLVKRVNNSYRVVTGSLIATRNVDPIKRVIDKINNMEKEELKSFYQETLILEEPANGVTKLGIIDLARKSRNKLVYNFKYESQRFTFFTLESQISKNSI